MKSKFPLVPLLMALAIFANGAIAQSYPDRPVRLIVGFPPGGVVDITARTVSPPLGERLGQSLIVDNRPGVAGNIAADHAAKAAPDGHTLLISVVSSLAISSSLYRKLPYDLMRDLTPVGVVAAVPNVLVVHPSLPAKHVKDLIALAKARPGDLIFGSAGTGSTVHFAGELFKTMVNIEMLHVPYKGAAPAMTDLLAGRVHLMFDFLSAALPHIKAHRLRALGVSSVARSPLLPDVPTIAEAGVPGYEVSGYLGIFTPAKTTDAIVRKLNGEIATVVNRADVKERFAMQGATPVTRTPGQFAADLKAEVAKWAKIVQMTGVQVD
jgi:tripartite-type tricarboxylate transporter receptor subunit TctC